LALSASASLVSTRVFAATISEDSAFWDDPELVFVFALGCAEAVGMVIILVLIAVEKPISKEIETRLVEIKRIASKCNTKSVDSKDKV